MPKLKIITEKQRAQNLLKPLFRNNLNQSATARELGVSQATINEKYHRPIVQSALQQAFRKVGISTRYKAKKFKELLESKRPIACDVFIRNKNGKLKVNKNSNDWIEVEDNNARVSTLRLLCQVQGDIKENGNAKGKGVSAVIIIKVEGINENNIPSPQRTVTSIQR